MSTTMITPAMARQIEIWPPGKLRAYDRNARTHSPEQQAPPPQPQVAARQQERYVGRFNVSNWLSR